MWFRELTGFEETNPTDVQRQLELSGTSITSLVNGRSWECGTLEVVKLANLRKRVDVLPKSSPLCVTEDVANVQDLHTMPTNYGALFQVASQFNLFTK
jgi:hypothetical protein